MYITEMETMLHQFLMSESVLYVHVCISASLGQITELGAAKPWHL